MKFIVQFNIIGKGHNRWTKEFEFESLDAAWEQLNAVNKPANLEYKTFCVFLNESNTRSILYACGNGLYSSLNQRDQDIAHKTIKGWIGLSGKNVLKLGICGE